MKCRFEITHRCCHSCPECFCRSFEPEPDSTLEAIEAFARRQLIAAGVDGVTLIGGEPLIRADITDIAGLFRRLGLFVRVISSGSWIRNPNLGHRKCKQRLDVEDRLALVASVSDMFIISLDDIPSDERPFRDPASVAAGFLALRQASALTNTSVSTTVHRGNLSTIDKIAAAAARNGAKSIHFQFLMRRALADYVKTEKELGVALEAPKASSSRTARCVDMKSLSEQVTLFIDGCKASERHLTTLVSPPLLKAHEEPEVVKLFLEKRIAESSIKTGCHFVNDMCVSPSLKNLVCPFIRVLRYQDVPRVRDHIRQRSYPLPVCEGCCGLVSRN